MLADMSFMQQNGLNYNLCIAPKVVLDQVCYAADMATRVPTQYCSYYPAIL